jgi:hypothetical protein
MKRSMGSGGGGFSDQPQTNSLWPGPSNSWNSRVGNTGDLWSSSVLAFVSGTETIPGGAGISCNSDM